MDKKAYMCGFHMYSKVCMTFLKILHGQLLGLLCLILYLKIFRLSEFFISIGRLSEFFISGGKFPHGTAPIVLIVSKPIFFVLIFLLVTVT